MVLTTARDCKVLALFFSFLYLNGKKYMKILFRKFSLKCHQAEICWLIRLETTIQWKQKVRFWEMNKNVISCNWVVDNETINSWIKFPYISLACGELVSHEVVHLYSRSVMWLFSYKLFSHMAVQKFWTFSHVSVQSYGWLVTRLNCHLVFHCSVGWLFNHWVDQLHGC